jgi:hypothetical protein
MPRRGVLLTLAGLTLPLALMVSIANQDLAGAGTIYFPITCAIGGTVTFSPPLSGVGESNASPVNELTSVTASLGSCLSSNTVDKGTTTGDVSFTITTPPIKVKVGKLTHYSTGECGTFVNLGTAFSKGLRGKAMTAAWSGQGSAAIGSTGVMVKSAAPAYSARLAGDEGVLIETSFQTGDYIVKTGSVVVFLTDGLTQIGDCAFGAPGTISSLSIDQRISTFEG